MIRDILEFTLVCGLGSVVGATLAHYTIIPLLSAWRRRRREQEVDAWRQAVRQLARRPNLPQPGSEYDAIFRDISSADFPRWQPLDRRPAELDDYDRRQG